MEDCLFCKIAAGEIPANKLYEDEQVRGLLRHRTRRPRCTSWSSPSAHRLGSCA
ncbi:MAG: hypothetical protein ACLVES_07090 [Faecalibacterium prausnitzii]